MDSTSSIHSNKDDGWGIGLEGARALRALLFRLRGGSFPKPPFCYRKTDQEDYLDGRALNFPYRKLISPSKMWFDA